MTGPATAVYFAPAGRLVFYVADHLRGSEVRLRDVFGFRGVRIDAAAVPDWLEELGEVGDIGPEGWMALRDGVLAAQDREGRAEAVRTAKERASAYGPAGRSER